MSPHIPCKAGNKYTQLDSPGTGWSCTGVPPDWVQDAGGGGGVSRSATIENVFAGPGSSTFQHNLNSIFYQANCVTRTGGSSYAPATWTSFPVDANNATVTVPAAGDYICAFSAVTGLAPPVSDFSVATAPTSQTFQPTMSGTQHPTFAVNQTAIAGYTGTATYSSSGLASGMTGAYSPTTITGTGSSTLTLSFPANQAASTTAFTVSGTDGTHTHTASPSITVGNINSGLVECWPMTDGSGTTLASSCGTSNTETVTTGTLTWGSHAGYPGTTPSFSATSYTTGTNQTATNFDGSAPFSFSTWATIASPTGGHQSTLISSLNAAANFTGWEVAMFGQSSNTDSHVHFFLVNNYPSNALELDSNVNTSANTQHFIVVTYDGSKTAAGVKFYVDGVSQATTATTNTLTGSTVNTLPMSIGARPNGSNTINTGAIMAYTRIYNRALSSTDVSNYFAAGPR